MDLLLKLLIAHLLADFLLQWPAMLQSKAQKKFASPLLYLHGVIHFALAMLIVRDPSLWLALTIMMLTHIVIDAAKAIWTNEKNARMLFFADQLLHVLILCAIANYYAHLDFVAIESHAYFYPTIFFLILITFPTSIALQVFFTRWELPEHLRESLKGGGVYIGYIERLLIFIAVVTQHWNIVGFLIAAKSLFRFGDVNKSDDKKYGEYILIGTLLSMTTAILAGMAFLWVTKQAL